ncbi:MAG: discoidin domain-containing protein [Desulfobacterota bacterium]|nr:discoidin domain-containing protein [Thermodesulfobacteriota bacterium]
MNETRLLDDFSDLSAWTVITSGQARLDLVPDPCHGHSAMRLDFDFCGGGGFVVARRSLHLELPESYCIDFNIRGNAPSNIFEFKFVDSTNANVWRYRIEDLQFPASWQHIVINSTQIDFAWGPRGGGPPQDIAALEIVIAAGNGGTGSVWLGPIRLTDTTYRLTPDVHASQSLPGNEPAGLLDPANLTPWRSGATHTPQWLLIDFLIQREYGGITINWEPELQAIAFSIEISDTTADWKTVYSTECGGAIRSDIFIPQTASRYIRINLHRSRSAEGFGIRSILVRPYDFSRSINHFFQNIAREYSPGMFPQHLLGRQSYWTPLGTGNGDGQALINEQGMIEIGKGSCSIEPFLFLNEKFISWANVSLQHHLAQEALPIPSVIWNGDVFVFSVTACAAALENVPVLLIRYRINNTGAFPLTGKIYAAIRPFQVTPPWQHWRQFGGVVRVYEIVWDGCMVHVNGTHRIFPLCTPAGFGAATFDEGPITAHLMAGNLPDQGAVYDPFGYASGALAFTCSLLPGETEDIYFAVPINSTALLPEVLDPAHTMQQEEVSWQQRLSGVSFALPLSVRAVADSFKTAAAHILINRDGHALHPGPRRYARSWIRDGVIMGAALARAGIPKALGDFMTWYAQFQAPDGALPDCADREGTEWLPEFDAYGQFLFGIAEYYRFTADRDTVESLWPAVIKTVAYLEQLRAQRLTTAYKQDERHAYYGLLPESMSHEGYMAHPVHAYWDDFWAIRGLRDAADMATTLGRNNEAAHYAALSAELEHDVRASILATMQRHHIDYIPASVELGDFDPTATANAIALLDLAHLLPQQQTHHLYEVYLEGVRKRVAGIIPWNNYSAYEIRIIGALVRLGRRADALELLTIMLADQRTPAWHQWPEITWRDPEGPSFLGDLPHTWISAEYILSVCSLFAFERTVDRALVVAAGIDRQWLQQAGTIGIAGLPTYYGNISYQLSIKRDDVLSLNLWGDLAIPTGGIVVQPPLPRSIKGVVVNGRELDKYTPDRFSLYTCPAEVLVYC